jgi:hypothetical protein
MVGMALAMLCLVSTLAGAVEMTCRASDGKGNCTAGSGPDGKEVVIVGTGIAVGEKMDCIQQFPLMTCESYATMVADRSVSVSTIHFPVFCRDFLDST